MIMINKKKTSPRAHQVALAALIFLAILLNFRFRGLRYDIFIYNNVTQQNLLTTDNNLYSASVASSDNNVNTETANETGGTNTKQFLHKNWIAIS